MELLEALNWRYATKRMTGEKIDQALVDQIIEAARLAPTSSGVQPFHVVAISNPELKQALSPIALNQPQIIESSHVLVFASWDTVSPERIDKRFEFMSRERGQSVDTYAGMVENLKKQFASLSPEEHYHYTAKQAHIGMGLAIAAAAQLGVDATPMEGFNKQQLDAFLQLDQRGLKSVTLLALGRRDVANDWLLPQKKVRTPSHEFVIELR